MTDDGIVRALVVVNCQCDYFEGGSYPLSDSEEVVNVINNMRGKHFDYVFFSTYQHPINHSSFASNNPVRGGACVLIVAILPLLYFSGSFIEW